MSIIKGKTYLEVGYERRSCHHVDSSIKSSGLELLKVEPMMFENALELKGELKFPDNFESLVAPKASGTLIKPTVILGDKVSQGDLLACPKPRFNSFECGS